MATMTRERAVQLLNELPAARNRAPIIDELSRAARRRMQPLGEYLLEQFAEEDGPEPSAESGSAVPVGMPPLTPDDQPLGPELKAMLDSGCPFNDTNSARGMKLFCSEQGMLWDKTPKKLTDGQLRKLNVARQSYWKWCEENGRI